MLATVEITPWHWVGFVVCVLIFLSLDLGVFHRKAHVVTFKEALGWTAVWFAVAAVFALGLLWLRPKGEAVGIHHGLFHRGFHSRWTMSSSSR